MSLNLRDIILSNYKLFLIKNLSHARDKFFSLSGIEKYKCLYLRNKTGIS